MQAVGVERGSSQCFLPRGAQLLDLNFFEAAISVYLPHLVPLKLEPFCGIVFPFQAGVTAKGVVGELQGYFPVKSVRAGADACEEKV